MTETYADGGLSLLPGRVATLTIARPARRNAMNRLMWTALPDICDRIAADRSIRVLILTGEGDAAFCSGADISEFADVYATAASAANYNTRVRVAQARLQGLPCPTVAAVRGVCYGGGAGLALACDLRVADRGARFAVTPAKLGLAYSPDDTWQLIEKVGVTRAKDLLLTGRTVEAAEAASIGLIDRLCDGDALAAAQDEAARLAGLAPGALRAIKSIVNGLSRPAETPALQAAFDATFAGAEFTEGYTAFLAGRKPDFDREFDQ